MSQVIEIKSEGDFNSHVSSLPPTTLLILSFYAPWAAPCTQMATVLKTLAASYPVTTPLATSWISVNAEDLPDISEEYDVTAVPFLVLSRGGTVLGTVSGSDASKVRNAIEKHAQSTKPAFEIPPPLKVTPRADANGNEPAKDSGVYEPGAKDAVTAPESTGETSKEDLHKRLSQLVKAAPVMLFMKGSPSSPQCGFSRQLVALLREKGVRYGFFNILADDEVRQGLKEFADWPTFPQLWVDGELVGGLDIVKEEIANDPEFLNDYAVKAAEAS